MSKKKKLPRRDPVRKEESPVINPDAPDVPIREPSKRKEPLRRDPGGSKKIKDPKTPKKIRINSMKSAV